MKNIINRHNIVLYGNNVIVNRLKLNLRFFENILCKYFLTNTIIIRYYESMIYLILFLYKTPMNLTLLNSTKYACLPSPLFLTLKSFLRTFLVYDETSVTTFINKHISYYAGILRGNLET